jgi:hypothetical protein
MPYNIISYIISYQKFSKQDRTVADVSNTEKQFTVNGRRLTVLDVVHVADVNYSIESQLTI